MVIRIFSDAKLTPNVISEQTVYQLKKLLNFGTKFYINSSPEGTAQLFNKSVSLISQKRSSARVDATISNGMGDVK